MKCKRIKGITIFLVFQFICVVASDGSASSGATCSIQGLITLPPERFKLTSCAICYSNILSLVKAVPGIFNEKFSFTTNTTLVDKNNVEVEANPDDVNNRIYLSFNLNVTREMWKKCCHDAVVCCDTMSKTDVAAAEEFQSNTTSPCSPTWSFYHCWPTIEPGEKLEIKCPDYAYAYFPPSPCKRYYQRTCAGNNQFSDQNHCSSLEFHRRPSLNSSLEEVTTVASSESDKMDNKTDEICCRVNTGYELSFEAFRLETCGRCYDYVLESVKTGKFRYSPDLGGLVDKLTGTNLVMADKNEKLILDTLISDEVRKKWQQCCDKAVECCEIMSETPKQSFDRPFCPRTWDGWQCFGDTVESTIAYGSCPDYIYFGHNVYKPCRGQAEKECLANGAWFQLEGQNRDYTFYTNCEKSKMKRDKEYFLIGCYAVSLVVLLPALIIFSSYRQLRVARIRMHRNFFLALTLNCVFTIILRSVVFLPEVRGKGPKLLDGNAAGCKLLVVLTRYLRMCSYTWMLCEGFYLHKLITSAFAEQKKLIAFYLVGWAFPLLPTSIYAIVSKVKADFHCWAMPTPYDWIISSVGLSCILINVLFLINIIRVLITKLRSIQSNEPEHYRKAVRATLVLIPLFGTQFVLSLYKDDESSASCSVMTFYNYFQAAVNGLQGFCVALIFCYMNGEVIYLLKRSYERYKERRGFQSNATRSRWSMSTQMSNALDNHNSVAKGTPPMAHGRTAEKNGNAMPVPSERTAPHVTTGETLHPPPSYPECVAAGAGPSEPSELDFESKGFGFDNVVLSKEKVTEL